jgi:hypothetical protein
LGTSLDLVGRHLVWHVYLLLECCQLCHEPCYRSSVTISNVDVSKRRGLAGDALGGHLGAFIPIGGIEALREIVKGGEIT